MKAECDTLTLVFRRNIYYRKLYLCALSAMLLGVFVIVSLIFVLFVMIYEPRQPLYFPVDIAGHLIEEVPLSQANMTDDEVAKWVIKAIEASSTFNFVNYRVQLQDVARYYTEYGWNRFKEGLNDAKIILAVTERKLIQTAKVVDTPKLVTSGTLSGRYAWKWTMPLLLTVDQPPYDKKSTYQNSFEATVIIQREPILQSDSGLGIVQLLIKTAT